MQKVTKETESLVKTKKEKKNQYVNNDARKKNHKKKTQIVYLIN